MRIFQAVVQDLNSVLCYTSVLNDFGSSGTDTCVSAQHIYCAQQGQLQYVDVSSNSTNLVCIYNYIKDQNNKHSFYYETATGKVKERTGDLIQ